MFTILIFYRRDQFAISNRKKTHSNLLRSSLFFNMTLLYHNYLSSTVLHLNFYCILNKLCSMVYTSLFFFPFIFFNEFSSHIHFTRTIFVFLTFPFPSLLTFSCFFCFLFIQHVSDLRSFLFFLTFFSLPSDFKVIFFRNL